MTVVNPRFDQSSAGGFDDLDGLLCVQRGPKSKSGRNETKVFAAVVEPELLSYSSDKSICLTICAVQFSKKKNVRSDALGLK